MRYGIAKFSQSGNFKHTTKFFNEISGGKYINDKLDQYGKIGVEALKNNTPEDTGKTADSWSYKIINDEKGVGIEWHNDNISGSVPVVILIEYGHATRGGGFVKGRDFINPTMKPIFDELSNQIWKEVTNA